MTRDADKPLVTYEVHYQKGEDDYGYALIDAPTPWAAERQFQAEHELASEVSVMCVLRH